MRKILVALVMVSLSAMAGCSSVNKSQMASSFASTTVANLEAKLDIGDKISGTASETCIFYFLCFGPNKFADNVFDGPSPSLLGALDSSAKIKAAAAYDAVNSSSADVIVAPRYILEKSNLLIVSTTKATVTGYKGTIKSVNQIPAK